MNIALPQKLAQFVAEQVQTGRFGNETEVVAAALESMRDNPIFDAPVYPPGSLLHLYTPEANAEEAKTIRGNSLHVEEW